MYSAEGGTPKMRDDSIFAPGRVRQPAYVDQTEARDEYYSAFLAAAVALCLLTAFGFAVPAIAKRHEGEQP
jgi:hypothetical protein